MFLARRSNPTVLNLFRAFALLASRLRCAGVTISKSLVPGRVRFLKGGYTACSQEPVVLDLVKISPSSFLVASKPVNSGAPEVPPEVSVGHFPLENQRAAQDRT